jgi:hypothetical protein
MTREMAIGLAATALAVVAMAFDHLIDIEEGFPADPAAFAISVTLSLAVAGVVFLRVIPRTVAAPDSATLAGKRGLVCGLLSVPALALVWLGVPFPLAGGAVALGLLGIRGARARFAWSAIALGVAVLALGVVGTDWRSTS